MSFLTRIKQAMNDPRYRNRSMRGDVVVREADLLELLHHFERLDAEARSQNEPIKEGNAHYRFDLAIREIWFNNEQKADDLMHTFSGVTYELLREKEKQNLRRGDND